MTSTAKIDASSRWAELRETHASAVFLAGDSALKIKKPVRTAFLDYSSVEARAAACEEEVRLNRRLSPDVYLGVIRIGPDEGGPGEPVVAMRRLRDIDQLAVRLRASRDVEVEISSVARCLADFHASCDSCSDIPAWELACSSWKDECDQIDLLGDRVASAATVRTLRRLGTAYLMGRRHLFEQRVAGGKYRDGHGDLRCEHVYLTERGVRVIDCLEFDARLRTTDTLSDIAGLVADLDRLGERDLGDRLMHDYREFTGDFYPASLLHFYVAHWLVVRAKVGALRAEQSGVSDHEPARLVALAVEHLLAATPVVICVGGLPGAGKSAVSTWLARSRGDVYLSSDEIRHERNLDADPARDGAWEQGVYAPAETEAVYAGMFHRAACALADGFSVVLDASWREGPHRVAAHDLAARLSAAQVDVLCQIDERTAYARVRGHRDGLSEAGVATRIAMKQEFDDWPGAHIVTTDRAIQEVAEGIVPIIDRELRAYSMDSRATS